MRKGGPLPDPRRPPASPYCPPQDWKEAAGHHWLLGLKDGEEKRREIKGIFHFYRSQKYLNELVPSQVNVSFLVLETLCCCDVFKFMFLVHQLSIRHCHLPLLKLIISYVRQRKTKEVPGLVEVENIVTTSLKWKAQGVAMKCYGGSYSLLRTVNPPSTLCCRNN